MSGNQETVIPEVLLEGKAESAGVPIRAFLEISSKCNFRCLHCYYSPALKRREMTYAEICSVLNQLADIGSLFLDISGGEPLMRADFWKIIEYARKREFAITLNTNGSLVSRQAARRLAGLFIHRVEMSIYGMDEDSYKSVTQVKGAFKRVIEAVEWLKREGIPLGLKMVLMRENFSQLKAFKRMAKKMDVEQTISWGIHRRLDACPAPLRHQPSVSQIKEFLTRHPEYCKPELDSAPSPLRMLCGTGSFDLVCINSSGEVMPCLYLSSAGRHMNILNKPLAEILKKDLLFQRLKNLRWQDIPQCLHCKAALYCSLCPANFALNTGRLISSPIRRICRITWLKKRIDERIKDGASSFKISRQCKIKS